MTLTPIDWIIIAVYMLGCTVAGLWMQRYVRNVADFAVAGREMEVSLGVASLAATEVGIVTVMYTAQMGFEHGLAGAVPGILTAVAMLVVGITGFVIVPLRNAGVMTIPELFENRFGKRVRWLAGMVIIIGGVLNMGVFLRAGGDFLLNITGMDSDQTFTLSFLGMTREVGYLEIIMTGLLAIVLVYTVLGGMLSVLITDYLQFLVMGLGIVVTSVLVVWNIGGLDFLGGLDKVHRDGAAYRDKQEKPLEEKWDKEVAAVRQSQGPKAAEELSQRQRREYGQSLQARAKELTEQGVLVDVGKKGEPAKAASMKHPFDPVQSHGLAWVVWQAITGLAVVTTWQTTIARVLAARDAQTAKRVYRGAWFYWVGRWCLPGLWGAAAFLYFLNQGGLPEGLSSLTAMPRYLGHLLRPITGFLGLMIAAMLAAEMSTDSGYLLTWATVIYNDLINPCLRRPMSERARLLTVRLLVLAIGVFLVFWGLWYNPPGSVWDYLVVTGNIYLASLFALLVGALYWRGANRWGAMAAIILGAAGPIAFLVINGAAGRELIPAAVSGLAAFGFAFAGLIIGSLLGRAYGRGDAGAAPAAAKTEEARP
jgi:Na+/proline symporter